MSNLLPAACLALCLSSCAVQDFYGREYVIYDRPASTASSEAQKASAIRVFEIERQAAELRAALAAGLDAGGRIEARLATLEEEREALAEALGDTLLDARRRRVAQLLDAGS